MTKQNKETQATIRARKDAAYKYVKLLAKREGIPLPSRTRGAKFDEWLDKLISEAIEIGQRKDNMNRQERIDRVAEYAETFHKSDIAKIIEAHQGIHPWVPTPMMWGAQVEVYVPEFSKEMFDELEKIGFTRDTVNMARKTIIKDYDFGVLELLIVEEKHLPDATVARRRKKATEMSG